MERNGRDVMPWTMYYNGETIAGNIKLADMETTCDAIVALMQTGGWYDYQYPDGDGIGMHRFLVSHATQISFHQEDDHPPLPRQFQPKI
jgi:hypothetical protein